MCAAQGDTMLVINNNIYKKEKITSFSIGEGEHIYNVNFTECDFTDIKLEGVTFTQCEFHNCNMQEILFDNVGLYDCSIHDCLFSRSLLIDIDFDSCYMEDTEFINMASMYNVSFNKGKIMYCSFKDKDQNQDSIKFEGTLLFATVFSDFKVYKTIFDSCQIRSCRFDKSDFDKSKFYKCSILGSWLRNLKIDQSSFDTTVFINSSFQHLKFTEDVEFCKCSFADVDINNCNIPKSITKNIMISPTVKKLDKVNLTNTSIGPGKSHLTSNKKSSLAQNFMHDSGLNTPFAGSAPEDKPPLSAASWCGLSNPTQPPPIKGRNRAYLFITEGVL